MMPTARRRRPSSPPPSKSHDEIASALREYVRERVHRLNDRRSTHRSATTARSSTARRSTASTEPRASSPSAARSRSPMSRTPTPWPSATSGSSRMLSPPEPRLRGRSRVSVAVGSEPVRADCALPRHYRTRPARLAARVLQPRRRPSQPFMGARHFWQRLVLHPGARPRQQDLVQGRRWLPPRLGNRSARAHRLRAAPGAHLYLPRDLLVWQEQV